MGTHNKVYKKLLLWCPKPESPLSTALRQYSKPLSIFVVTTMVLASVFLAYSLSTVHTAVPPLVVPTPTPLIQASPSPTPTPIITPIPAPSPSLSPSPTNTLTPSPSPEPTPTATPSHAGQSIWASTTNGVNSTVNLYSIIQTNIRGSIGGRLHQIIKHRRLRHVPC